MNLHQIQIGRREIDDLYCATTHRRVFVYLATFISIILNPRFFTVLSRIDKIKVVRLSTIVCTKVQPLVNQQTENYWKQQIHRIHFTNLNTHKMEHLIRETAFLTFIVTVNINFSCCCFAQNVPQKQS